MLFIFLAMTFEVLMESEMIKGSGWGSWHIPGILAPWMLRQGTRILRPDRAGYAVRILSQKNVLLLDLGFFLLVFCSYISKYLYIV